MDNNHYNRRRISHQFLNAFRYQKFVMKMRDPEGLKRLENEDSAIIYFQIKKANKLANDMNKILRQINIHKNTIENTLDPVKYDKIKEDYDLIKNFKPENIHDARSLNKRLIVLINNVKN